MIHPVDYPPSQNYGDNPTKFLPADHWLIQKFGNYQPDGHTGTDYPCPAGTPVRAVAPGRVVHAGYFTGTYEDNPYWIQPGFAGYTYVVDHGWFVGIYGHCKDGGSKVTVGQWVDEGQELGPSGNTGASTGEHLHFEILMDGWIVNSYMYGRINPAILFAAAPTINALSTMAAGSTTSGEDDMFTEDDRKNLEKLVHQNVTIVGMLNNMAMWMNESGNETRDNVRKVTLQTVYGEDVK